MQIFTGKNLDAIHAIDVFQLLGMQDLDQAGRDNYMDQVQVLIAQYFFQEKIGDLLTEQEMNEIIAMPHGTEEELQTLLSHIGTLIPNASDLYLDAIAEVKGKLVHEQYAGKLSDLNEMLTTETDETKIDVIHDEIKTCERNLALIEAGEWALVNQTNLSSEEK